ncbi:MAG TPA: MFS transporter [Acidimicrobiia bacterium]|nr:MFS transporter [Acidimicrobiia bacterium]
MPEDDQLQAVREGEAAIDLIEKEAHELRGKSLAALGFGSEEPVPSMREGVQRVGAKWSTVVRVSILAIPLMFLNLVYLRFDLNIAMTLGIDPLGYEYPALLNSLISPLAVIGIVVAGFVTAALVFKRRWRGYALAFSAFGFAAALWFAAFATIDWGLVLATALAGLSLGAGYASSASLVMDSYPPDVRVRSITMWVFGLAGGLVIGNLVVSIGVDAWSLTWRGILMILAGIASLVALLSIGIRDPGVGKYDLDRIDDIVRAKVGERGALAGELSEDDVRIGFGEQLRQLFQTRAATSMLIVFFLFGTVVVPFQAFISSFVVARYSWTLADRSWLFTGLAAIGLLPLLLMMVKGDAWFRRSPARLMNVAGRLALLGGIATVFVAFIANEVVTVVGLGLAFLGIPMILAVAYVVMQSVVEPRLRPHAAAVAAAAIAGAVLGGGVLAGQFADRYGVTASLVFFALTFLGVGASMRTASEVMSDNVATLVEAETQREELRVRVSTGQHFPLLGCRNVDFSYGKLQVLFGVDFTVDDGELVALLGTNGAGKSTLLKVISGIGKPTRGSVHYRGADITYMDSVRRVQFGIAQMPGGRAVFGNMTVAENLRMHGFTLRRSKAAIDRGMDATFDAFPVLAERRNQPAATLSGGEQQMLALGKAFILQPRLLLIDELSLGLAPLIVGQLIAMVRRINESGTAVVVVEQSVNIALTLVDHAYFMERGQMRFDGVANDLIDRPDLLRSVFLEGASKGLQAVAPDGAGEHD